MDVPRVDSAQLRLVTAQMQADTALDLVRGDRFTATVVTIHEAGEIVLATPRGSFVSQSDVRLAPGQSLDLEVVRGGTAPTLRIVDGALHFDEQAFAEAVLEAVQRHAIGERQVDRHSAPPLDTRQLAAALRDVAGAPNGPLTPEQRVVAARLLSPVDPHASTREIAEHVRALVEDGGTLLEPHLRAGLDNPRPPHALPREVANDLRVLLAALLGPRADSATANQVRERLGAEFGRDVLERQLDQALQWIRSGTLVADVPIAGRDRDRVRMEYRRDASSEDAREPPSAHAVRLAFDLEVLGRVEMLVSWAHDTAALHARVGDEATRARLSEGLADLRGALRARGLSLADAGVEVAVPAPATVDAPSTPPPSGSILRLVG